MVNAHHGRITLDGVAKAPGGAEADTDVRIRSAVATDTRAISEVFNAAVRAGWRYLGALTEHPLFSVEEWEQTVTEQLSPPNALLVAVDSVGTIAGFVATVPTTAEIHLLFVHPKVAGRGIGRLLLSAGDDVLRTFGCASAILYTHEQNERALHLYRAAGYSIDGTTRDSNFRGVPIREVRMTKPL